MEIPCLKQLVSCGLPDVQVVALSSMCTRVVTSVEHYQEVGVQLARESAQRRSKPARVGMIVVWHFLLQVRVQGRM